MTLYEMLADKFVRKIPETGRYTFSGFTYQNDKGKGPVLPALVDRVDSGGWCFYDKRSTSKPHYVRIDEFVLRFAANGIVGVRGYVHDGTKWQTTSITFDSIDLFKPTAEFRAVVNEVKTMSVTTYAEKDSSGDADGSADSPGDDEDQTFGAGMPDSTDALKKSKRNISLSELENRLARQREIGAQGEEAAFRYECARLHDLGCDNPIAHIEQLSQHDVGAGYDLRSTFNGLMRCIEVKASVNSGDSFFLSENERKILAELGKAAYLYRVLIDREDAKNSKVVQKIQNPMGPGKLELEAVAYKATVIGLAGGKESD